MTRWNPWRALRARDDLRLHFDERADAAGGAVYAKRGDDRVIVLSPTLGRRERSASLAHELVHDERGITTPGATDRTMQGEERRVRLEVARRLVPADELLELARERSEVGPLMAWEIADHFDVPEHVAVEAVRQLQARMLEQEMARSIARISRER